MTSIEAEGLADLGLWTAAWEALEELPAELRAAPPALRVRLRCCPPLGAWEIGSHVAGLLRDGDEIDRAVAAGFYMANARRLVHAGDKPGAAESIKAASETWPDCRQAILLDPVLVGEFF